MIIFGDNLRRTLQSFAVLVPLMALSSSALGRAEANDRSDDRGVQHGIVYFEEGRYGGWPANHGMWSWDDEVLVGFVAASYRETRGFHTYDPATARSHYARSGDGGLTWTIEDAYERGQTARGADNNLDDEK